VATAFAFSNNC